MGRKKREITVKTRKPTIYKKTPLTPKNENRAYPGADPREVILPEAIPDPEDGPEIEEDDDGRVSIEGVIIGTHYHKKYPSPRKDFTFRKKWKELIESVATRDNFKLGHLSQLEVLCDLYVEYEKLSKFLRMNGYTYQAWGRQGLSYKPFPEVTQLNRCKGEIRNYTKMLGLTLVKDTSKQSDTEGDEWK